MEKGIKNKKSIAIVLAGGKGSRMNSELPKQYMCMADKPLLYYSLKAFQDSFVNEIILVAGDGVIDGISEKDYCREEIINKYNIDKCKKIADGGKERYNSVYNALKLIDEDCYVFIHDGARPCVDNQIVEWCMEDVIKYGACVAAVPVKDTIKIADESGFAKLTPDRNTLWQIQTPQVFEFEIVKNAYDLMISDNNKGNITDDAMVVETYSDCKVKLTNSKYENIKVTTPEDMDIVRRFLGK